MNRIEILDENTVDKIAAGEVVERPSSVVKELVENAIDAGATAITVEITDGGKKLIRITDNGSGIEADQVRTAFLRHATSKIRRVEDLQHIASLGFRGEALSSIAAVSNVELITKTPSAICGIRYLIDGGREQALEELGAPDGTTFLVRNLFYNVPARNKFLKSDITEGNYVSALMEQLALSHPEISFKYIQNRQVKLHSPGNYSVRDVIYNIYGKEITRSLLPVSCENEFLKMEGFIGKPEIARGNRSFENYYVNGRYVKNKILTRAIEDGYKGFLMQHKFPFVSLHFQMDGNELDVNVHPAKMEVRFARGAEVYDCICDAIHRTLSGKEMIPDAEALSAAGKEEKQAPVKRDAVPEPFEVSRRTRLLRETKESPFSKQSPFSPGEEKLFLGSIDPEKKKDISPGSGAFEKKEDIFPGTAASEKKENISRPPVPAAKAEEAQISGPAAEPESTPSSQSDEKVAVIPAPEPEQTAGKENSSEQLSLFREELLSKEARPYHKLIGQIFDTYWLVEYDGSLYIIDQHAAHEKVWYERLVKQFREKTADPQYMSPPMIVSLTLEEEHTLKSNLSLFQAFGFEIENFGGREYAISAFPSTLYQMSEKELFLELLDHLETSNSKDPVEVFAARLATMACKAAVKGNNRLSEKEAGALIDELLSLENPYHCPHGRPTIISMTRTDLEKKFRRIV